MNDWEENKCKFYSRLPGNKLIYQSYAPITMSISEDDKKAELDCFIDNIRWRYGLFELKDFVENNRKDFYNNILSEDYPMNNGTIIPKGMKIIKAFILKILVIQQCVCAEIPLLTYKNGICWLFRGSNKRGNFLHI